MIVPTQLTWYVGVGDHAGDSGYLFETLGGLVGTTAQSKGGIGTDKREIISVTFAEGLALRIRGRFFIG